MKIVMIINKELPVGLIANTAAVLGISLGNLLREEVVGADLADADGHVHPGITAKTIPILAADREQLKEMRSSLYASGEEQGVKAIDFSEVAQKCLVYEDYTRMLTSLPMEELYYLGICLYGPEKKINKLTGNLPLLRECRKTGTTRNGTSDETAKDA